MEEEPYGNNKSDPLTLQYISVHSNCILLRDDIMFYSYRWISIRKMSLPP